MVKLVALPKSEEQSETLFHSTGTELLPSSSDTITSRDHSSVPFLSPMGFFQFKNFGSYSLEEASS